jgi:hypothetical protein
MKKKRKGKAIKDLYLDRPTSHGGWPDGHGGSYTDPDTPVNQQIANYLKSMGLVDDDNPRARLSESTSEYNVYDPLSLQDPVNKIINAIIRSTSRANSAEEMFGYANQMMLIATQIIPSVAPISEKQAWYLSAAILRVHQKFSDYKNALYKRHEDGQLKSAYSYRQHFFDSPLMDEFRKIMAMQESFQQEVKRLIPQFDSELGREMSTVTVGEIDDLKYHFAKSGLVNANDGTWVGIGGRPPDDGMKRHLYSKAIVDGYEPFFVNENKIRSIIRESIKRLL